MVVVVLVVVVVVVVVVAVVGWLQVADGRDVETGASDGGGDGLYGPPCSAGDA